MQRPWLQHYPDGIPAELPAHSYTSLAALLDEAFAQHATLPAFHFLGSTMRFAEIDAASRRFAAYLQSLGLAKGDRVALMMPNSFQYPVAVAAVVRAGLVVVNVNPLYTPRELEHQLADSGARVLIVLENMAKTVAACIDRTPVEHVVVTRMGDMLPPLKGAVVNFVLRYVKKLVPAYSLPKATSFKAAMKIGKRRVFQPVSITLDDVALLQYTGGTTGVAKGATLTHRNIVANVLQSQLWYSPATRLIPANEQQLMVCALPLYHIFGFTVNMMMAMRAGSCNILIPNPRDIPAVLKELAKHRFHSFPAVATLFAAIARHPDADKIDWSSLKLSVGGGMPVQPAVAELWKRVTGSTIVEGYGLSETSPSASCNPCAGEGRIGTIGLPLTSTELRIIDGYGRDLGTGAEGEIAIRGPQVMRGYWNRPDETAAAMTADGFLRTGDIGIMDADGFTRIVDRKKDMINVSGFNVYPNEIEAVVTAMPGIVDAAAIGVPNAECGEMVKLFVVAKDASITADDVKAYCRERLTGYKRPREIEFRKELPKSAVGKVLRRELREGADTA
ncbi:AMP-binding protein [Mangrovicella endophytica]|uniref:AMP-binding protein n=1 Tax=Mangrovicella endophytica TaxID=2066697 RepID=UPI000C9EBF49|nr:AMP-binding protein [Mangrovicella endophytica]